MINVQKTRLMTKCAVYEKNTGKEDMRLSAYFKADFIRLEMLKNILLVTLGYFCICLLVFLYRADNFLENIFNEDFRLFGQKVLLVYVMLLIAYITMISVYYAVKYSKSRERLGRYYKMLGKISRLSEEAEKVKELEDLDVRSHGEK